jgi:hypothetical protein
VENERAARDFPYCLIFDGWTLWCRKLPNFGGYTREPSKITNNQRLGGTTGISSFVVCLRHTAKAILHSANALPSVTLGKERSTNCTSATVSLPSTFCRALGKDFVECHLALGKEKSPFAESPLCRVFDTRQSSLCRVSSCTECSALSKGRFAECLTLPSAALGKAFFAECPTKGTRQRIQHSAKPAIPVVRVAVRKIDLCHLAQKVLVFDEQRNLWTNVFASVYVCSSQDAKRIGLRQ